MSRGGSVLGIDLGTSSVKMILRCRDGTWAKAREAYEENTPAGWWKAVRKAMAGFDLADLSGIGLSGQVGTYLADGRVVARWSGEEGKKELQRVKEQCSQELFLEEISMPHPDIISYPLPRLLYIKDQFPDVQKICQPKDFLYEMLTGICVTDQYSWRGLANQASGRYSQKLLGLAGFPEHKLPKIRGISEAQGNTRKIPLSKGILPEGIPVFTGMNDFYAAILGMGILKPGELFDITGTSEHLGAVSPGVVPDTRLVSSPYLKGNVHYGVTASAGAALDYGMRMFGFKDEALGASLKNHPPVFLPYLNGERAPIWDVDARGMFFGIHGMCRKEDMAYAVLEGVAFSLYHIYEQMGMPQSEAIRVSGGAASNRMLNQIKAELFGLPVLVLQETDTSALGACMAAAAGLGWYEDFRASAADFCSIQKIIEPEGRYRNTLRQRYEVYKELYPAVKNQYKHLRRI